MKMTTIFEKSRFKLLSNGVTEEQYNNCNEISTTSPTPLPVASSTPPPPPSLPPPPPDNSVDNVTVVKSQVRSLSEDLSEPELDIIINNVVCSFSVGCHLNLRQIALHAANVEFKRESGMVTMKLRKPKVTASIWSSGKITCTGATSEDEAKSGARRTARIIQKLGFNAKFRRMRIVNVLGSCKMPFEIKINGFSQRHREYAEYEPELHPGVTFKIKAIKATLKIFSTGSITVTAPSVPNVQLAIEHIFPLVQEFRKELSNEVLRKRMAAQQRFNQDKVKRKRLNSGCSSNDDDDDDKEVKSYMSQR